MNRNLGQTGLRRKRRGSDPMVTFDNLPAPLRHWLCDAAMPWSPTSVRRIWKKARANGKSLEETLMHLSETEARILERDER